MRSLQDTFTGQQPENPFKIKRADLLRIFQIGNPEFFVQYSRKDITQDFLSEIQVILSGAGCPEAKFFEESSVQDLSSLTLQETGEPNGAFLLWVDYSLKQDERNQNALNRSLLLIANYPEEKSSYEGQAVLNIHFVMTGKTMLESGTAIYVPDQVTTRYLPEGETQEGLFDAENATTSKGYICYAEEAARCIFAGFSPNPRTNEEWCALENETLAARRYDALLKRTQKDFEKELRQREKAGENYEITEPIGTEWLLFNHQNATYLGEFRPNLPQ